MAQEEIVKVCRSSEILLEIKHSQFIAYAVPLNDLACVDDLLVNLRAKQAAARHHVYAWRFYNSTNGQQYAKFSDDGEPSQTAGAPLFNVLMKAGVNNTLLVVSRIFGGILLGAGGLVRAYSKAGSMALQSATYEKLLRQEKVTFTLDYAFYAQFTYACEHHHWQILDVKYADKVTLYIGLNSSEIDNLERFLAELCAQKVIVKKLGLMQLAVPYNPDFIQAK